MSDYARKNLMDIENMAPRFGYEGGFEARFGGRELGASQTGISMQRLPPDSEAPFGHRHEKAEEIYVVLEGSGRMKLGDDVIEVGRLDAIRVDPEVPRAFAAGADGLTVLAFGTHHENDGELLHGFWQED
jgi:uncharacterized cupin superfamily protein